MLFYWLGLALTCRPATKLSTDAELNFIQSKIKSDYLFDAVAVNALKCAIIFYVHSLNQKEYMNFFQRGQQIVQPKTTNNLWQWTMEKPNLLQLKVQYSKYILPEIILYFFSSFFIWCINEGNILLHNKQS